MKEKPWTLAQFKLPTIKIDCPQCGRHGEYAKDRAIARHGADMPIYRFIEITANCRNPKCRAGCDDLMYMFQATPFTIGEMYEP